MGRYDDRGGPRFQRSQSQNDLDRQTFDDRFHNPTALRSSASSGFNVQHDADGITRRHPSDVGGKHRRSYSERDGTRMLPTAADTGDNSRTDAMEQRRPQMDQKLRSPSDPSRNLESSRYGDHRDPEYPRDYDGQRVHSAGDEFRRSHEDLADVRAVSKKPSVRNGNPKNQDIINWLQHGDGRDPQPRDSDYIPDGRDINRSTSNYSRTGDKPGNRTGYESEPTHPVLSPSRSYPATNSDGDASSQIGLQKSPTSGPRTDRDDTIFPQFGVSNPTYDAGYRPLVSEQTQSTDSSMRGKDAVGQHQGYLRQDPHSLRTFSQPISLRPDSNQSLHSPTRGMGYVSPGHQQDASSRIPPPKPVHTIFSDSPSARGLDQSEDRPPALPPKLATQQVPLKPPQSSPSQLDQYQRPVPARSVTSDHQLRVMKDKASEPVDSASEYAIVQKRPVQSVLSDRADSRWRGDVEKPDRPRADGAGYPLDMASQSRQSPDGTLDSADHAIQPPAANVSSSSDFGKEQRPGMTPSSRENVVSPPPVRPPLPSDKVLAASGLLETLATPTPTTPEQKSAAENTELQVNLLTECPIIYYTKCTSVLSCCRAVHSQL